MHSSTRTSRAYIGVGSNQGDRLSSIATAAQMLAETPGVCELTCSPIYETQPMGPVGPETFLNAVFELSLRLSPMQLLSRLQEIETELGRRPPRSGARPIDLDLLIYDDLVFQNDVLTIPHPRLTKRAFVLQPLADLAPDICHPESGFCVCELLALLPKPNEIIGRFADPVVIALAHAG
ncbi:MAG: 2-amino-4-hydroxy-6-hydroxymethyldihydropteridine diphosphokinase [candidate division Zixibacteria bacterium]|nr:2-amino-4-hydroxy-6-hydroxymethyldihydropteridine diphosphokinase [candidate division Zixibacteria bacterium]